MKMENNEEIKKLRISDYKKDLEALKNKYNIYLTTEEMRIYDQFARVFGNENYNVEIQNSTLKSIYEADSYEDYAKKVLNTFEERYGTTDLKQVKIKQINLCVETLAVFEKHLNKKYVCFMDLKLLSEKEIIEVLTKSFKSKGFRFYSQNTNYEGILSPKHVSDNIIRIQTYVELLTDKKVDTSEFTAFQKWTYLNPKDASLKTFLEGHFIEECLRTVRSVS